MGMALQEPLLQVLAILARMLYSGPLFMGQAACPRHAEIRRSIKGASLLKKKIDQLFAVTAPGLEELCAGELQALGIEDVRVEPGGVAFSGALRELYLANLWLRTSSRVLVRVGQVRSRDFPDLFRRVLGLPWGRFLRSDTKVRVKATSHQSRLNHTGRIAETVSAAIDRALGRPVPPAKGGEQIVIARFDGDLCQLSVDSSGALLHRRGYRQQGEAAPLRETLAAAMLQLAGWDRTSPLVDPLCGSGTLVIEAALLAANRAPGQNREFSFMNWPRYRPGLWEALLTGARRAEEVPGAALCGFDRAEVAVAAAVANAERAGVEGWTAFSQQELADLEATAPAGWVVCNPPYGERLGRGEDLAGLYRDLGEVLQQRFRHWRAAVLCPDEELVRAMGVPMTRIATLSNGGIRVGVWVNFS